MKPLYVRPAFRGGGLGQLMIERLIAEARVAGYRAMRLNTMPAAVALYRRVGFVSILPYWNNVWAGVEDMELTL